MPSGAVLLVDPVVSGRPFKAACRRRGLGVASAYTLSLDVLNEVDAGHSQEDDYSIYGRSPDELLEGLGPGIRAVVPATEPGVYVADTIAKSLGLPGNDATRARARRDKAAMRRLAVASGIPVPKFEVVSAFADITSAAAHIGYPLVLKASTGAASRDVHLVRRPEELPALLRRLNSRDLFGAPVENWLVEQYVHGPEFAINTFTVDGEHHIIDIWEYCQPDLDAYDQPYWDLIQLGRDDPRWDEAAAFAPQVAEAFGVRLGPAHIEAKVCPDGFTLIEVGARLPGACMPEHWIAHSRFHPYDDTLSLLLGEPYRNRDVLRGSSGVEFDAVLAVCCIRNDAQPGILRAIRGADAVLDLPGVDAIHLQLAPGDRVPVTRDLNSVVAKVLVSGTSRAELRQKLHAIRSTIQLEIVS